MIKYPARYASIALLLASSIVFILSLISYFYIAQLSETRASVRHTYEVIGTARTLDLALRNTERDQRRLRLTGQDADFDQYHHDVQQVTNLMGTLRGLTRDNFSQQIRLLALAPMIQRKLERLEKSVDLVRNGGLTTAPPLVDTKSGLQLTVDLQDAILDVVNVERGLLAERTATDVETEKRVVLAAVGGALALAVLLALSGWLVSRAHSLYRRHEAQAQQLLGARSHAEEALRASEGRLAQLLSTVLEGVIVAGENGHIASVNPAAVQMFGFTEADEMIGQPLSMLMPATEAIRHDSYLAAHASTGKSRVIGVPGRELRGCRKDGSEFPIDLSVSSFRSGEQRFFTGVLRDATQRKEAERILLQDKIELETLIEARTHDLRESQARAAHAERVQALGQLAGGIAHDFNNVLQGVQGGAGLILAQATDPEGVRRLSRMIQEAVGRGAAITGRMLAFSRQSDLKPARLNANELLAGLKEVFDHTLGSGVAISIDAPPKLPMLLADRGQLESVLINLATNARDAMSGIGALTLSAAAETVTHDRAFPRSEVLKAGFYVRLSVADTGTGMDEATLARVVEPFFTTKDQGHGTGLGLAMANGFAEQSGGVLHIESRLGHGTVVSLWLPAANEKAPGSIVPGDDDGRADGRRGGGRLLFVDDDELVREVITKSMEASGFFVVPAASGAEALAFLDAGTKIDLLLSDLTMPGMNGLTLIVEAKRRKPGLPAILLTGFAGNPSDLAVKGAVEGSFSLLRKPIEPTVLAGRVAAMLEDAAGR